MTALSLRRLLIGQPARSTRAALAAGVLLFLLPCAFFWRVWWPATEERRVFAYGDFVEQHYPMRVFVASELRAGRLPFWSPYTLGGEPAVAESLFASYYPLGLWQTIFPRPFPFLALELEAIFHLGLAGLFTCLFIRRLTGRLDAGILAGVAFSLCGFLTSYPMLQLIILEAAVWLPAALWLMERSLSRRSYMDIALAGAALACSVLAGHFQTSLYVAYVCGAYWLLRATQTRPGWRFAITATGLFAGVAISLSAAQWLPSLEMARLSPRDQLTYAEYSKGFAPAELWGLLRPNAGQWSPLYVGIPTLALALLSPLNIRRNRQSVSRPAESPANIIFWLCVIGVALLLSLGGNGFLYPLAYRFAPGFSLFRQQERVVLVIAFGLVTLAGFGYAWLTRQRVWRRPVWGALLALIFFDLYLANQGVILQKAPAGGYFAATPAVEYLNHVRDNTWRISSEGLLPGDGNAGLVYQFRDVVGSGPLYLADFERFLKRVPEMRWWQMLNVDYILTRRPLDHGALAPILEDGDQRLYQVFLSGKPAWIVHTWQPAGNSAAAIEATAQPACDPFQTVILEQAPSPAPAPPTAAEEVRLHTFKPQRVSLEASLSAPGIVVLSEVFYPGWRVWVNGRPAEALRAYGILRAVALPAGFSRIEWRFVSGPVWLGLAWSLLTLAAGSIVVVVRTHRN